LEAGAPLQQTAILDLKPPGARGLLAAAQSLEKVQLME